MSSKYEEQAGTTGRGYCAGPVQQIPIDNGLVTRYPACIKGHALVTVVEYDLDGRSFGLDAWDSEGQAEDKRIGEQRVLEAELDRRRERERLGIEATLERNAPIYQF